MKKILLLLIIIGAILMAFGPFVGSFLPIIEFLGFVFEVLAFIGFLYDLSEKRKQEKRDATLLRGQEKIIHIQEETKQEVTETEQGVKEIKDKLVEEFTSRRILRRIRRSLRGVLSTEDLIEEFDSPLNALVIYKWGEPRQKLIRDRLAELGFKDIGAGLKILPPSRMPHPPLKNRRTIENWLKRSVLNFLPKTHKYSIVFAQIVDLRKVYATKYAPEDWFERFRGYTLLEKLSWEELFPIDFIRKILAKKTNVSVEELVVEHFPFCFLISRFLNDEDFERVLSQRDEVIQDLKKCFNLENVTLIDFADMNVDELSQILTKLKIMNTKQIAKAMVDEAKLWNTFLENL